MNIFVSEAEILAKQNELIETSKLQDGPPIFNAKLAVPAVAGVPVMVKVKLPLPLARVPAERVAVRPVTPVEEAVCAL
jgi:hypothetical protein